MASVSIGLYSYQGRVSMGRELKGRLSQIPKKNLTIQPLNFTNTLLFKGNINIGVSYEMSLLW
jgi:hypothetical protein